MKSPSYHPGIKAGILGGGQLARMLAEVAPKLGIRPIVFAESSEVPAAKFATEVVVGNLQQREILSQFLKSVELVVFESEFIDTAPLKASGVDVPFLPSLPTIERLRDKLRQKELLRELQIPTADFVPYDGRRVDDWVAACAAQFGGECVIKWGQQGYDGKGVLVLRQHAGEKEAARVFCEGAIRRGLSLFAEQRVDFARELALVSIATLDGHVDSYPLVISEQRQSICWKVTGPAISLGVDPRLESEAQEMAQEVARVTELVGTFALELFETTDGRLLVNEMAPRVHNSGHFTQDGADSSQFENHWRAVAGLPLGSLKTSPGFVMLNILGPEMTARACAGIPMPDLEAPSRFHWYDKAQIRTGRKMGHINGRVDQIEELPGLVTTLEGMRGAFERTMKEAKWRK